MNRPAAIILTFGELTAKAAKTAHGLIRESERFRIAGVVDQLHHGNDAGQLITGTAAQIPVFASLDDALDRLPEKPAVVIVGSNPPSGTGIPPHIMAALAEAIAAGISVISAMHEFVGDDPKLADLALASRVQIVDVRRPRPVEQLHFWSGKIAEVTALRVAVLGDDVRVGKRTTTRLLTRAARGAGLRAEMVYTGQTGWIQGGDYGFILDSTINDFVAGEMEHAVYQCWADRKPDVIFIEGQGGLRYPPSPAGCTYLTSAGAKHVVLQHAPKRRYYDNDPALGPIGPIEEEIELIRLYGAQVIALALNTTDCSPAEALRLRADFEARLGIPVLLPLEEGVAPAVEVIAGLKRP